MLPEIWLTDEAAQGGIHDMHNIDLERVESHAAEKARDRWWIDRFRDMGAWEIGTAAG